MEQVDERWTRFLSGTLAEGWVISPLAGDASARRYARLAGPDGRTAILMDAGEGTGQDASLSAFLRLGGHLAAVGLCPPAVLAEAPVQGLLLLEDLGADTIATWLDRQPDEALHLYPAAVDVLIRLQAKPPPDGLLPLVPTRAAGMIGPLFDWYLPGTEARVAAAITGALQRALVLHAAAASHLALRDYHAENLIWRPDRQGTDRVGLLDFQDAVLAPAEYDLISLLRDARRPVSAEVRIAMIDRFSALTGRPVAGVLAACACLGVQRNLRILGIFARLARQEGKRRYLAMLPRVHMHVMEELDHPALATLRPLITAHVPPPETAMAAWGDR